ncbi:tyrosine-type recombinase/integrase [Spongiivirga citrea]|uniref:Tyrosine recombinase XerC n=1 Tax=Spongiivirga citrea TaxID=1481457 RepID=A0A6M0CKE8_9FLAO|nr:tyrosine-type recombinase/integrase [Spongiivirga citrea]NER18446.1 tyrosine-type recombinase/integrase [Spongiivirga citrea]
MLFTAFADYLKLERNYSDHTLKAYLRDLEAFSSFSMSSFDVNNIDDVNYAQIRSWIISLVDDGISNNSINRKIASLKAYYKFLLKIKEIEVNPLAKHRALKTPKKIQVPFSREEMNTLDDLVFEDTFEGKRDRLIIELLYATGMRRAELINLTLDAVDVANKQLKVLGKRDKERYVPVLQTIINLINDYVDERSKIATGQSDNYLLLTKKGLKLYDTLVYRVINNYFSKASTKAKKSPHILRHTFATHMLNQGADLNAVKELLGHASLASTQVYTHNSMEELKKVYSNSHPRNEKK